MSALTPIDQVPAGDLLVAMRAFAMNPGHSDLDDEQPEIIAVGDKWVRATMGEIRRAQRSVPSVTFCSLKHGGNEIADAAHIAYWAASSGVSHDYHVVSAVEAYDKLGPLIEAIRATYCPKREGRTTPITNNQPDDGSRQWAIEQ